MIRNTLVVGVVLLMAGAGAAFAAGIGPALGGDSGSTVESFPTETPSSPTDTSSGGDSDGTTATDVSTGSPYAFSVDRIEECGETCRDVTATLTNEQSTGVSNVTIYTRIYTGNGTDGDVVWEGTESVGDLSAGESYMVTERVELSLADAYAVKRNDG